MQKGFAFDLLRFHRDLDFYEAGFGEGEPSDSIEPRIR
jgi:hypothetical protein